MQKHKYQSAKFPVGDQVIHHFYKKLISKTETDFFIAGGAITSFLSGDKIKDFDLFFKSRKDAFLTLIKLRKDFEFKLHFSTKEAIKGSILLDGIRVNIDIVKRTFNDPFDCIKMFDFTVCCFAVDSDTFYYHENAAFDLLRKKLVVNNLPFPVSSTRRMNKYIKKGFSVCNGTILEILTAVRELDSSEFGLIDFYPVD